MYYVTIKNINTEHERKNSISQAIIPYSLIFLVFCSRVESFLAGVSAGREGRRQTNETLLTTDIFTPPGDYISSKYMSASEVLRYPCINLCNYIKPPTSSFFVLLTEAGIRNNSDFSHPGFQVQIHCIKQYRKQSG